jgi:hypothetical protein
MAANSVNWPSSRSSTTVTLPGCVPFTTIASGGLHLVLLPARVSSAFQPKRDGTFCKWRMITSNNFWCLVQKLRVTLFLIISQFALWVFRHCAWWIDIPRICQFGGHSDSWNRFRLELLLDHFPLVVRGSIELIFALYPIPLRSGGLTQLISLSWDTTNSLKSFLVPGLRHDQRVDSVRRLWVVPSFRLEWQRKQHTLNAANY